MAGKDKKKQPANLSGDQRRIRKQQIIMVVISIIIILAMVLSFVMTSII